MLKKIAAREAIRDVFYSVKYFAQRYPTRTALVVAFTLVTSVVEFVSIAMVMPILSLATQSTSNNPILFKVVSAVEYVGLAPTFLMLFAIFIATMIIKAMLLLVLGIYVDNSSVVMTDNMRSQAIRGIESISWSYLTHQPHGLVVNLMAQEIAKAVSLFASVQVLIVTCFLMVIYLYLGLIAAPAAFLAMLILGGIGTISARPFLKMSRIAGMGQINHMRSLTNELSQGIQAYKAFKAMAREQKLLSKLGLASKAYTRETQRSTRASRYLAASQQIILAFGLAGVVYVSYSIVGNGLTEIGFIVVVMMRLHQNLSTLLVTVQKIINLKYALVKVDEMINDFVSHREINTGTALPSYPAPIRFDQVSFKYDTKNILDGVDFTIAPWGMTAIVGASGVGKTTLIDLLCGFYKPTGGRILIENQDLADIDMEKWRHKIGYVTQEPNLLNDTIRANVAAFDQSISDEKVIEALKGAGAWDFVSRRQYGIHSRIGVSGGRISGGERQRVAIARALAQDPDLLILDEPTAALDAETERALIETFFELKRRIVIVAISHQPAMAAAADVVFRMDKGRLVAADTGTPDVVQMKSAV